MNKKNCKECFHFYPSGDPYPGEYIAGCGHSDCFKSFLEQTWEGEMVKRKERKHDIIDFNPDGSCTRFVPFYYKKVKTWWLFKKRVRVMGKDPNPSRFDVRKDNKEDRQIKKENRDSH